MESGLLTASGGLHTVDRQVTVNTLAAVYGSITKAIEGLGEAQLGRASRCAGWTVADVVYHVILDARRALRTFVTPTGAPPEIDDVRYWMPFSPRSGKAFALGGAAAAAHARHVRIASAAYPPAALFWEWRETSSAVCRAARSSHHPQVAVQGLSMRVPDFVATLIVEAAIHLLDIGISVSKAQDPDPAALGHVRRVLDGLLGGPPPVSWDDRTYALKGTGRLELTSEERFVLGPLADQFPVFG